MYPILTFEIFEGFYGEGCPHVSGADHVCAGAGSAGGGTLHRRLHLHARAGGLKIISFPGPILPDPQIAILNKSDPDDQNSGFGFEQLGS